MMNIHIKNGLIFLVLSMLSLSISCRSDKEELVTTSENHELRSNSRVAMLMLKTVMNDGSIDNILDGSSCLNIKLPVTITLNDNEITINSEEDLLIIEELHDEFEDDSDEIAFIFPITVLLSDFSEVSIKSVEELEELFKKCDISYGAEDDDIECIDFKYPFTVSVFNAEIELIENITFYSDEKLFDFLKNLNEDDIVNVNFPITVVLSDTTQMIINNLDQLEETIENIIGYCNENDFTTEHFTEVITTGSLVVKKYNDDETDETENFKDYIFNFYGDGIVAVAIRNNVYDDMQGNKTITISGSWTIRTRANGSLNAILDFGNEALLNKLNGVWNVDAIKDKQITLLANDNDINKDELFFEIN